MPEMEDHVTEAVLMLASRLEDHDYNLWMQFGHHLVRRAERANDRNVPADGEAGGSRQ
jgi:hypothetical protein